MYHKIILFYTFCGLLSVNCDLGKEEGAECEWNGIKGVCANERKCLTSLDKRSDQPPVCTLKGDEKIICCTDCELVNDTRNAVLSPTSGLYWKTGQKAWDKCLELLESDLPYECKSSYYSSLDRHLDKEKQCHRYGMSGVGGPPPLNAEPRSIYPHTALIGYGKDPKSSHFVCGGTIISEKYILTAAYCSAVFESESLTKYAAFGMISSKPRDQWQHVELKRIIVHPERKEPHKYNDIALVETATPITFNKNVLPACLYTGDAEDATAEFTTWRNPDGPYEVVTDTQYAMSVKKYPKEECEKEYPVSRHLRNGYDDVTQLCYGDKENPTRSCKGFGGAPLLVTSHISWCFHTVIGVTSFGTNCGKSHGYEVYTKVSHYVPWIESVVWP